MDRIDCPFDWKVVEAVSVPVSKLNERWEWCVVQDYYARGNAVIRGGVGVVQVWVEAHCQRIERPHGWHYCIDQHKNRAKRNCHVHIGSPAFL